MRDAAGLVKSADKAGTNEGIILAESTDLSDEPFAVGVKRLAVEVAVCVDQADGHGHFIG